MSSFIHQRPDFEYWTNQKASNSAEESKRSQGRRIYPASLDNSVEEEDKEQDEIRQSQNSEHEHADEAEV